MPDIFVALIPALAWGVMPLAVAKAGGKPANQILGTAAGAFAVGLVAWLVLRPVAGTQVTLLGMLSGVAYVVGQLGQFFAFGRIGVSKTMPISAGLQLVGTSLVGVLFFGDWPGVRSKLVGFAALAVVVLGIFCTAVRHGQGKQGGKTGSGLDKGTLLLLFVTNFGYLGYSSIPDVASARGTGIFLPQTLGMLLAAVLYVLFSKGRRVFGQAASWRNLVTGILFAAGALAYIVSAERQGIVTAYIFTQLSVVISTLGGIFILREHKSRFELAATVAGLVLVVAGSAVTATL